MTEEQIKTVLNLIDNYQLADAFEFLDKADFKNPDYAKMKKSFISGIQDVNFIDRLKTLIRNANEDGTGSPSSTNSNNTEGIGNITIQGMNMGGGSNITINTGEHNNSEPSFSGNSNPSAPSKNDFENVLKEALEKAKGTTYEKIIQDKTYEYQRWKLAKLRGDISGTEFLDKETKIDREVREMLNNL